MLKTGIDVVLLELMFAVLGFWREGEVGFNTRTVNRAGLGRALQELLSAVNFL